MSTVRMSLPRRRRWILYVVGALVVLAILFTVLSGFYIDLLWYREVDFSTVFWTTIRTKVLLGVVFGLGVHRVRRTSTADLDVRLGPT